MHKRIGEYLVEENKLKPAQLERALELQANSISGGRMPLLGTILVGMGTIDQATLEQALERQEQDRVPVKG